VSTRRAAFAELLIALAVMADKESTGLMILTNDGRWSRLLTEPDEAIPRINGYH
jgi:hypothetical protein